MNEFGIDPKFSNEEDNIRTEISYLRKAINATISDTIANRCRHEISIQKECLRDLYYRSGVYLRPEDISHNEDRAIKYSITDSFSYFNGDFGCYDIHDILTSNGVVGSAHSDHEYSCCHYSFKNHRSALGFVKRFNKFMKIRAETAVRFGLSA